MPQYLAPSSAAQIGHARPLVGLTVIALQRKAPLWYRECGREFLHRRIGVLAMSAASRGLAGLHLVNVVSAQNGRNTLKIRTALRLEVRRQSLLPSPTPAPGRHCHLVL